MHHPRRVLLNNAHRRALPAPPEPTSSALSSTLIILRVLCSGTCWGGALSTLSTRLAHSTPRCVASHSTMVRVSPDQPCECFNGGPWSHIQLVRVPAAHSTVSASPCASPCAWARRRSRDRIVTGPRRTLSTCPAGYPTTPRHSELLSTCTGAPGASEAAGAITEARVSRLCCQPHSEAGHEPLGTSCRSESTLANTAACFPRAGSETGRARDTAPMRRVHATDASVSCFSHSA